MYEITETYGRTVIAVIVACFIMAGLIVYTGVTAGKENALRDIVVSADNNYKISDINDFSHSLFITNDIRINYTGRAVVGSEEVYYKASDLLSVETEAKDVRVRMIRVINRADMQRVEPEYLIDGLKVDSAPADARIEEYEAYCFREEGVYEITVKVTADGMNIVKSFDIVLNKEVNISH